MWAGDLHDGLIGFQLNDAIVGRNHVTFLDEHVHNIAAVDIFAQLRKLEVDTHRSMALIAQEKPWKEAGYFLPLAAGALAAEALAPAAGAAAPSAPSSSSLAFFFFFFIASL